MKKNLTKLPLTESKLRDAIHALEATQAGDDGLIVFGDSVMTTEIRRLLIMSFEQDLEEMAQNEEETDQAATRH